MTILWGVRVGAEAWQEEIITTNGAAIDAAKAWATANGFDRFRVASFADEPEAPDFAATINI